MSVIKSIEYSDQIGQLISTVFPELTTRQQIEGCFYGQTQWLGIHHNGKLVATLAFKEFQSQCLFIYNVVVDINYRRQGLASQLLSYIIRYNPQSTFYLFVEKSNRNAIGLYRRFEFEYTPNALIAPDGSICLIRNRIA
jgi:predicted acetyltransferase